MAVLIPNLHKLTFDRFMDIAVEEDLSLLIIEGEPTKEELEDKWEELLSEFNEKMGGPKGEIRIGKQARQLALANKINRIAYFFGVWRAFPCEETAAQLRAEGLRHKFTPETWKKDVAVCANQVRSMQHRLAVMKAELGPLETDKDSKPTYESFTESLVAIGSHHKMTIKPAEISTLHFCTLYNQFIKAMSKNTATDV